MSSVIISGDTSGAVTVAAPAVAGTNTLTLQAGTATNSMNTLATAVASTSGTSINFIDIPSWVKRVTMMLNGVSTSGTSNFLLQIGAGSISTSGYVSQAQTLPNASSVGFTTSTAGAIAHAIPSAAGTLYGQLVCIHMGGNLWSINCTTAMFGSNTGTVSGSSVTLGGALDRIRLTTVNGTDTFDAGTVNILYEG